MLGQEDAVALPLALELQGRAVAAQDDLREAVLAQGQEEGKRAAVDTFQALVEHLAVFLFVQDMNVECLPLLCRDAPRLRGNAAAACAVDARTVGIHEGSDVLQPLDSLVRQLPVGTWPYVQQEVGIHACCLHEAADEFVAALVVLVRNAVAPCVVHRHAGLKGQLCHLLLSAEACRVLSRQVLLEELKVLDADRSSMMVVAYHALGLQTLDEGVLLVESPVELLLLVVPHAIEPDGSYRPVVSQQFCKLHVHEGIITVPIACGGVVRAVAAAACRVVKALPVHVAVVEVKLQSVLSARLGQGLHHVASVRRGLDDVVGACLGLPHGEAVVVAAGEGDVLCSGLLEELHPFACIEPGGTEASGELGVLVAVDAAVVHHPLSVGQHGIDAPMDEDAKLAVLEVLAYAARLVADDKALCCRHKRQQKGKEGESEAFHIKLL